MVDNKGGEEKDNESRGPILAEFYVDVETGNLGIRYSPGITDLEAFILSAIQALARLGMEARMKAKARAGAKSKRGIVRPARLLGPDGRPIQ